MDILKFMRVIFHLHCYEFVLIYIFKYTCGGDIQRYFSYHFPCMKQQHNKINIKSKIILPEN